MSGAARSFLGQPRGLLPLFGAELWERFSYYGMRALLFPFMVLPAAAGGLGLSTASAAGIYGTYTMSVYLLCIPGGIAADRLLGARRAVLAGGALIACGHFALAARGFGPFYAGLGLVALGTGLLKPSINALVGALYAADDPRRDAGFSLFYLGINLGALIAPFATGFLAQHSAFRGWLSARGFDPAHSWHWGFAAAGFGMLAGLGIFAGFGGRTGSPGPVSHETGCNDFKNDRRGVFTPGRAAALGFFFVGAVAFWALFEQMGSSLNLFASEHVRPRFLGVEFPSAWYQAVEPLFVVLLAGALSALWTRLGGRQPSAPTKFALALALLAAAFGLMAPAARLSAGGPVSPLWLVGCYLLEAGGELCLSPVGLSSFTRLSPPRLVGAMLGLWFLADAVGNRLAGALAAGFGQGSAEGFFARQALVVAGVALVLFALAPRMRRLMAGRN